MADAANTSKYARGAWSEDEHQRFLDAMAKFPKGPWKTIAECIGTRSVRQAQTHAQQHHEKMARQLLGLRRGSKTATATSKPAPLVCSDIVSRWRALEAESKTDGILMSSSVRSPSPSSSSSSSSSEQGSPVRPSTDLQVNGTELSTSTTAAEL